MIVSASVCLLLGVFTELARGNPPAAGAAAVIIPVEGERFEGELVAMDADGRVTFRPADASPPRVLPLGSLVRWGHPPAPRPQTWVLLTDGSRLVASAAWGGGPSVQLAGDQLIAKSDLLEEIRAPRRLIRGIIFAERDRLDDRQKLEDLVHNAEAASDELLLTNGDRFSGRVTELAGGTLKFVAAGNEAQLPLTRLEVVILARPPGVDRPRRAARPEPRTTAIALRDGSILYAATVRASATELRIQLNGGLELRGGTAQDISAVQTLGGERLVYLSDLTPTDYRHVPYLTIEWPFRPDRSVAGGPLFVADARYLKGLGMHSAARLTYALDGKWRRFEAAAAIDDSAGRRGSVAFGVHLLRGGQWQAAYASPPVRGGERPIDVSVDLAGADGLTLTVDFADRGDELDHADWLDARLVR